MLLHRTRADDGLATHRVAIAALGMAVSRARSADVVPLRPARVTAHAGPAPIRLTDAPKSPSRRRSRGRGSLRAVAPDAAAVVPLAEVTARRARTSAAGPAAQRG